MRIAVPSKGRLLEGTLQLLRDAGLQFEATDRALSVPVRNTDAELLFIRTEDIPGLVAEGIADAGITGQDLLAERNVDLTQLVELGFGRCRLVAAVPRDDTADKLDDLAGRRLATAHPVATRRILAERGIDATVVALRGSVEVAPKLGVADAIVDLVSSGSTLLQNGLREVDTLLDSQAVLVCRTDPADPVRRLATALSSVVQARRQRYVLLNAPAERVDEIVSLIPGLTSPTVVPEADASWVAVHSVVERDSVWDLLPRLREAGATGILVLRIDQMVG